MRCLLQFLFLCFSFQVHAAEPTATASDIAAIEKVLASDNISALDALIQQGIDVNMRDSEGNTLLIYTLNHNDNLTMAQQLIIAGADVDAPSSETGATPLILATSMASALQQQSKKIQESDDMMITNNELKKFMLAQMNKAFAMLQMLIEAGADVNKETPYGTPLMDAVKNEWNEPIIQQLLENGAKVNFQDRLGRTALFYASAFNCNKNISTLLAAGGDINIKDVDGKSYMESKPKDYLTE